LLAKLGEHDLSKAELSASGPEKHPPKHRLISPLDEPISQSTFTNDGV
jgi:hypothetical protein